MGEKTAAREKSAGLGLTRRPAAIEAFVGAGVASDRYQRSTLTPVPAAGRVHLSRRAYQSTVRVAPQAGHSNSVAQPSGSETKPAMSNSGAAAHSSQVWVRRLTSR